MATTVTSWNRDGLEYITVTDLDQGELEKFEELYKAAK